MNLKQETWELIVVELQNRIQDLQDEIDSNSNVFRNYHEDMVAIKKDLISKANEITELNAKLREYEKRDEIEHFIKQMGRRYYNRNLNENLSWIDLFYSLYPSADETEYRKKGKAKEAIIGLLRSRDLGFDDDGAIFRLGVLLDNR